MRIFSSFGASKRKHEKPLKQGPSPSTVHDQRDAHQLIPSPTSDTEAESILGESLASVGGTEGAQDTAGPCVLPGDRSGPVEAVSFEAFSLPSAEVCQIRTMTQNFSQQARAGYEKIADKMADIGCVFVELFEHLKAFEDSAMICHGQHENMSVLVTFVGGCLEEYGSTGPLTKISNIGGDSVRDEVKSITAKLEDFTAVARTYSQPGWVYRLCIDSGLHSELVSGASALVKSFGKLGLGEQQNPVLQNTHKWLVSELRCLGSGSWATGLAAIREHPDSLAHLAKQLRSSEKILIKESYLRQSLPWAIQPVGRNGAREEECSSVFLEYCSTDGSNLLSAQGFQRYMADSQLVKRLDDEDTAIHASCKLFVKIDQDFDGYLSLSEFQNFYLQRKLPACRSLVRLVASVSVEKSMQDSFDAFCAFGASGRGPTHSNHFLDSFRFSKLCKDSRIITSRANQKENADIVFSKCVPANSKRMDFDHFLVALTHLSVVVRLSLSEVCKRVAACPGPSSTCTKANYVKLHDDKTLFTGIYARGGPDIGPTVVDMESYVNREKGVQQATLKTEQRLEITLPESPKLATTSRIASPGPKTPGRGASLDACEARKVREELNGKLPRPSVAFGRSGPVIGRESKKKPANTVAIAASTDVMHERMVANGGDPSASTPGAPPTNCSPASSNRVACGSGSEGMSTFLESWRANIQPKFVPLLSSLAGAAPARNLLLCQIYTYLPVLTQGKQMLQSEDVCLLGTQALDGFHKHCHKDGIALDVVGPMGKVWENGDVQVVQYPSNLSKSAYPMDRLPGEAIPSIGEIIFLPIYDAAINSPTQGIVAVIELILSKKAHDGMIVATIISTVGEIMQDLGLSLSAPMAEKQRDLHGFGKSNSYMCNNNTEWNTSHPGKGMSRTASKQYLH